MKRMKKVLKLLDQVYNLALTNPNKQRARHNIITEHLKQDLVLKITRELLKGLLLLDVGFLLEVQGVVLDHIITELLFDFVLF